MAFQPFSLLVNLRKGGVMPYGRVGEPGFDTSGTGATILGDEDVVRWQPMVFPPGSPIDIAEPQVGVAWAGDAFLPNWEALHMLTLAWSDMGTRIADAVAGTEAPSELVEALRETETWTEEGALSLAERAVHSVTPLPWPHWRLSDSRRNAEGTTGPAVRLGDLVGLGHTLFEFGIGARPDDVDPERRLKLCLAGETPRMYDLRLGADPLREFESAMRALGAAIRATGAAAAPSAIERALHAFLPLYREVCPQPLDQSPTKARKLEMQRAVEGWALRWLGWSERMDDSSESTDEARKRDSYMGLEERRHLAERVSITLGITGEPGTEAGGSRDKTIEGRVAGRARKARKARKSGAAAGPVTTTGQGEEPA